MSTAAALGILKGFVDQQNVNTKDKLNRDYYGIHREKADRAQQGHDMEIAMREGAASEPDLTLWTDPSKVSGPMSPIPAGGGGGPAPSEVGAPQPGNEGALPIQDNTDDLVGKDNSSQMQLSGAAPTQGPISVGGVGQPQNVATQQFAQVGGRSPPRFAEGGPIEVPAALPAQQMGPPGPEQQMGPPEQQGPPAPPKPTYREAYNGWFRTQSQRVMMAGGLEGYQKFQEMENAKTRSKVMGFAMEAVRNVDNGMTGEAVRQANTALSVTPFDTGMKFEARDGKLHLIGKDGSSSGPLGADHLRAWMEDNLKTPENYLEWKQQNEVERAGKEGTRQADEGLNIDRRRMALDEETQPQQADAQTLAALAAYENSQANRDRAARMAAEAAKGGWDNNNILAIRRDTQDWILNEATGLSPELDDYFRENKVAAIDFANDVAELQLYNPWNEGSQKGSVGREVAGLVSQLIRQPGGIPVEAPDLKEGDFVISSHKDAPGELIANYKGQLIALPKVMHIDAKKHSAYREAPQGGGKNDSIAELPKSKDKERTGALDTGEEALSPWVHKTGEFFSTYPGALQE